MKTEGREGQGNPQTLRKEATGAAQSSEAEMEVMEPLCQAGFREFEMQMQEPQQDRGGTGNQFESEEEITTGGEEEEGEER